MNSPITTQSSLPVWRRKAAWLALIPALGILCLAAIPPALSGEGNAGSNEARLEGSWLETVTLGGEGAPPPFESPVSFIAGGVMIGSQPSSPDMLFTPWHGTWTKTGRREFVYTAICLYWDSTVSGVWKVILKETVMIEPGGDAYNSTSSSCEAFGPNYPEEGQHWGPTVGDSTHGVRIKAE